MGVAFLSEQVTMQLWPEIAVIVIRCYKYKQNPMTCIIPKNNQLWVIAMAIPVGIHRELTNSAPDAIPLLAPVDSPLNLPWVSRGVAKEGPPVHWGDFKVFHWKPSLIGKNMGRCGKTIISHGKIWENDKSMRGVAYVDWREAWQGLMTRMSKETWGKERSATYLEVLNHFGVPIILNHSWSC